MLTQSNDEKVVLWRALLQLAQVTHAVLEREIPECQGLPPGGLPILRLLRWKGPETIDAIAIFLGTSRGDASDLVANMLEQGIVRRATGDTTDLIQLDARGVQIARNIATAQRERIDTALSNVPAEKEQQLAKSIHELAYGLVSASAGFGTTCAGCWAHDTRECVKPEIKESCVFCRARCTDFDPPCGDTAADPSIVPTQHGDSLNLPVRQEY